MNVSLVYPSLKNAGGWCSLGRTQESLWINHGVASLAACLQQEGHNVRLFDLRDLTSWGHFEALIKQDTAMFFGVSMGTLDYYDALKAANVIRKVKPDARIVVGGPHPSICPDQVAGHRVFDFVVMGEGEVTFPRLVANPDGFNRVVQGERADLDKLPIENREVFNLDKIFNAANPYTGKPFFDMPFLNVISGRGCVFRCGFCKPGEDLIFGKFRMRSLDHFFKEINFLHKKYDFKTLMIDDDSFTLNPNYTLEFCDSYERIGKPFFCQSRADFIVKNPDVIKRLKDVGLSMVFVGFESGSQRMLDFMKKDVTVEQNFEAAAVLKKFGVKIWANFMVGLPSETKVEAQATFDMIKKIKPEHPSGAFFTPIVGTELYNYCKENGLIVSDDPTVLGSRNPSVPKIKGVNYRWLRGRMYKGRVWKGAARKVLRVVRSVLPS